MLKKILSLLGNPAATSVTREEEQVQQPYAAYNRSRKMGNSAYPCYAPWSSISFNIDGTANVCCLNKKTSVSVAGKSIDEIWNSAAFNTLRDRVAAGDLDYDCASCKHRIDAGNFHGTKSVDYDVYFPYHQYPQVMEFCLENTCNLACTMCNTVLSSTIRKKHHLLPSEKHYDDNFVAQLDKYIPHLKEAVFAGGEPFLIPMYFKIWERMVELNPNIVISVVTNGTTLNSRIKNLLENGRFKINISIDTVDKATYESIRVGADFDTVMDNFAWYRDYGVRKNLPLNIPVCPMTLNWQTIPDTVRFANENNVYLNFVHVEKPFLVSLAHAPLQLLNDILAVYRQQSFSNTSIYATNNNKRFAGLTEDIQKWRDAKATAEPEIPYEQLETVWNNKINSATEIKDEAQRVALKQKVEAALLQLPLGKRPAVLAMLCQFSAERLWSFLGDKNDAEILVIFEELTGR